MNKKLHIFFVILWVTLTLFGGSEIAAQTPEGREYTVQADDWLSKLAQKEYGDPLAYPVIVEATNARAAEDDSFVVITNPDIIEIGQKLWLPAPVEEPASVAGIYKTFLPGASSPGLDRTLYLNFDNTVRWLSDYLEGNPPIIEVGSWQADDELVTVTITGQEARPYDEPSTTRFAPTDTGLALVPEEPNPEVLDVRYFRFEQLAREPQLIPYDPAEAAGLIQQAGFVGFYKGFLPAASSPGRDITLLLGIDDQASLQTDFLNGEPPIVESGTWTVADNLVTVSLTDTPFTLDLVDGTLQTTPDVEAYGQEGLTFYRFDVMLTSLYSVLN